MPMERGFHRSVMEISCPWNRNWMPMESGGDEHILQDTGFQIDTFLQKEPRFPGSYCIFLA